MIGQPLFILSAFILDFVLNDSNTPVKIDYWWMTRDPVHFCIRVLCLCANVSNSLLSDVLSCHCLLLYTVKFISI